MCWDMSKEVAHLRPGIEFSPMSSKVGFSSGTEVGMGGNADSEVGSGVGDSAGVSVGLGVWVGWGVGVGLGLGLGTGVHVGGIVVVGWSVAVGVGTGVTTAACCVMERITTFAIIHRTSTSISASAATMSNFFRGTANPQLLVVSCQSLVINCSGH